VQKPLKSANRGDILISVRAPVGAINLADQSYCIGRGLAAIRFLQSDPDYGYHAISFFSSGLRKVAQGTTFEAIGSNELRKLGFPEAPRPEQRHIAEILDTIDEAIRKTEQVIAKLQQRQQGLTHDLLTRGIDENGELRDPERHPEQFKDSLLGRIPRSWTLKNIESLADNHDSRRIPLKQEDRDRRHGSFPYHGASGVIDWIDAFIFDGDYVLLGEDGENVVSRRLPLAFSVSGRFWANNHAHIFTPKDGIDPQYLVEVLEAQDYTSIASGSAQPKITQEGLARLLFAVAPHHEQLQITTILTSYQNQIISGSEGLKKLGTIKEGLVNDLLTGRVRVTTEKEDAA